MLVAKFILCFVSSNRTSKVHLSSIAPETIGHV